MSSRILPLKYVTSKPLSGSFTTDAMETKWVDNIGLQFNVTTSANTGQFSIQGSNDGINWAAVTTSPAIAVLAGANVVFLVNINQWPFAFMRVAFAIGSGTNGSVDIIVHQKGF